MALSTTTASTNLIANTSYSTVISHISQSSCISGMWMVACLQSFPSQRHFATHVVRPPWSTPLRVHGMYSPATGQSGEFVSRTITSMWEVSHTRPCPVILTVNDAFSWSGTCAWMTSPSNQQMCWGCGLHPPVSAENVYMSVEARDRHVSVMASLRRLITSIVTGGSRKV